MSLRDPGSYIDTTYPAARAGDTLFRGSGTSQATAVTSAAAALILQARPTLRPDQLKKLLEQGTALTAGKAKETGLRMINVAAALGLTPPTTAQGGTWSSSYGQINLSRGANVVSVDGVVLQGEMTVFGAFNDAQWSSLSARQTAWSGGRWVGIRIAGDGWTGTSFASRTWAATTWVQSPWGGGSTSWVDPSWSGRFWAGNGWSSGSWSGRFWASGGWSGGTWG
jgi:serine protease AprX